MTVRSGRAQLAGLAGGVTAASQHTGTTGATALLPSAFVGRGDALAALTGALDAGPALVLIEGEAGIGKSRLVREFLRSSAAEPLPTLLVVCPPFRESSTLGPILDAVRQAKPSVADLELSPLAGALRPVFPEWTGSLPPLPEPLDDAKASRHRLLSALAELVERLGFDMLVLDDAHWADDATLEFLLLLTSRQQPRPHNLVVTYRPEDVPDGSLLRRLSHAPESMTLVRLTLQPLDRVSTTELVSSMLSDGPVSEKFAAFLHEHTDGLPLLIEESLQLLNDRDDLIRRDGQWVRRSVEELLVPPTVRDAVLERLDRLDSAARHVLHAAAVLAEPIDHTMVGQVTERAGDARSGLAEALASGLLREYDRQRVAFRHDLLGRAVYESIPAPERRRLHRAAGTALETIRPLPVMQLNRHFREAGDVDKWAEYAEQAADRAVAANDHTTAARLLNDVLKTAGLPAHRCACLAPKLARATLTRSEPVDDLNRQVVRTLRTVLDSVELSAAEAAVIRNRLGRLLTQVGDWEAGYRELASAASNLAHDPVEAARVMTYLGLPLVGPLPASVHRHWLQRAARLDSSVASLEDRVTLTADRAMALLYLGEEDGWELAAALPTTASNAGERRELVRAHSNLVIVSLLWGRYADADRHLAIARSISEPGNYKRFHYKMLLTEARLAWFTGAWEGLAERLTALLDLAETGPSSDGGVLCAVGQLSAAQGARVQAEVQFHLELDQARRRGTANSALEPAAELGRLWLAEGRVDDALQVTYEPTQVVVNKGIWIWATEIAPVRVEALVAGGRVEEAGRIVARFARGLHGRTAPAPRAALALCRALLARGVGDHTRAAAVFSRAARTWDKLPRPYDALLARERQAYCLLDADRIEEAIGLLSEVSQGLINLGARGDADRVARELRQRGVTVPRPWRGGRRGYGDQLSPRELEIVRLVVAGKTNAQIARVLSKSQRTVSTQLHSAMGKLDVPSRTALAVKAIEIGIVLDRSI